MYIYIYIHTHICVSINVSVVLTSFNCMKLVVQLHETRQRTGYTESVLPTQRIRSQLRAASMALRQHQRRCW